MLIRCLENAEKDGILNMVSRSMNTSMSNLHYLWEELCKLIVATSESINGLVDELRSGCLIKSLRQLRIINTEINLGMADQPPTSISMQPVPDGTKCTHTEEDTSATSNKRIDVLLFKVISTQKTDM